MEYTTPEKLGISSENILELVQSFDNAGLSMHDVIIYRHGKICYEAYWAPFHRDFAHRMYSVTKSFVSIGVGFLIQDGLVDIDDRILKYFPEEESLTADENVKSQTIRNMLMMATARCGDPWEVWAWSTVRMEDRVKHYFETVPETSKAPGTLFQYDSNGSFILCAMIERVTGKSFLNYMREKVFDKIGMSENIECLICPGGHSWGDSALIMPATDLLKFAAFVMNKGKYKGEQILNEEYVTEATKKQLDNNDLGNVSYGNHGYGYQIWRTFDNSFAFIGMGAQFAICVPDKDLIFVCNADTQGITTAYTRIFENFFNLISRTAKDFELPENPDVQKRLTDYSKSLKLTTAYGEKSSSYADVINGKEFILCKNPMNIEKLSLHFDGDTGCLRYKNKQGEKELKFGMCENVFGLFPETGYSDECCDTSKPGHQYKCAASAGWVDERKLYIRVQIIDKYFGNLHIKLEFNEHGRLGLAMHKNAEAFLNEYQGYAAGDPVQ